MSNIAMTEAGHMRPPMHNTLVFRSLREYRNKYSSTESVGVYLQPLLRSAPGKLPNSMK